MKNTLVNKIFFAAACLLSLAGCESMVNDIDASKLPKTESKLVVECYISPQSDIIQVLLTESQPLFGVANSSAPIIKNATVTISGQSGQSILPFNDTLGTYSLPTSQFKIEAGKTYHLAVSDPTRSVKASCTVPANFVSIKKYTLTMTDGRRNDWDSTFRQTIVKTRFQWDDFPNEKNYYTARGYIHISQNQYNYGPGSSEGKIYRYSYKNQYSSGFVTDANLDGLTLNPELLEFQLYNQTMSYSLPNGQKVQFYTDSKIEEIYAEILNVDENYYKFHQTMRNDSDGNPFVEPTLVYTNIEGGLGCFGAFNASITTIVP